MTYDQQLIEKGECPELVPVYSEDFPPSDGRCLRTIVPAPDGSPGFACANHTPAIWEYTSKSLEERWAEDAIAERYDVDW
jgi:hypothetical protein